MGLKEEIEEANKLYGNGQWAQAKDKCVAVLKEQLNPKDESAASRIIGYSWYFLGKKNIEDPKKAGQEAISAFQRVLDLNVSTADNNSALAGMPLAYQYLLGNTQKALEYVNKGIENAANLKEEAIALNTKGLIQKDARLYTEALFTFSLAHTYAKAAGDLRTAASAANNYARTNLDRMPLLDSPAGKKFAAELARHWFKKAKRLYKKSEELTGQSAKFHLDGIGQKLMELEEFVS